MKIIIEAETLEIADFIEKLQKGREKAVAATTDCACGEYNGDSHTDNMATVHKGTFTF